MPHRFRFLIVFFFLGLLWTFPAHGVEVFAKGMAAKNYLSTTSWEEDVSVTAGLAFSIFSAVRLEARYTNFTSLQNTLTVSGQSTVGTLTNVLTQSDNISGGIDISFTGDRAVIQPFMYIGAGYIVSQRSYYFSDATTAQAIYVPASKQEGVTGNLGAGLRIVIARHLALEFEVFGYGMNITKPNPLINYSGTAGIRIFM